MEGEFPERQAVIGRDVGERAAFGVDEGFEGGGAGGARDAAAEEALADLLGAREPEAEVIEGGVGVGVVV